MDIVRTPRRHCSAIGVMTDPCCGLDHRGRPPAARRAGLVRRRTRIVASRGNGRKEYRCIFGRDSDLEAFSHNPSDGSLAPLAYQPST